jgi:hypothetical protein
VIGGKTYRVVSVNTRSPFNEAAIHILQVRGGHGSQALGEGAGREEVARPAVWRRHSPSVLYAELAQSSGGGIRVRCRHHVDRGVRAERVDGLAPGVLSGTESRESGVLPRGPPRLERRVPALPLRCASNADVRSPCRGVSVRCHGDLLLLGSAEFRMVRSVDPDRLGENIGRSHSSVQRIDCIGIMNVLHV